MMGADQFLAGQLIDGCGQPFGQTAGVDEDDCRAVLSDQLEDARMDRRPDAPAWSLLLSPDHRCRPAIRLSPPLEVRHVVNRDLDRDLHRLDASGVDDGDLAICAS